MPSQTSQPSTSTALAPPRIVPIKIGGAARRTVRRFKNATDTIESSYFRFLRDNLCLTQDLETEIWVAGDSVFKTPLSKVLRLMSPVPPINDSAPARLPVTPNLGRWEGTPVYCSVPTHDFYQGGPFVMLPPLVAILDKLGYLDYMWNMPVPIGPVFVLNLDFGSRSLNTRQGQARRNMFLSLCTVLASLLVD